MVWQEEDVDRRLAALGVQIRTERIDRGLTQKQVAELSGVAVNAVSALEAGRNSTLRTLAAVLAAVERADWMATLAPAPSVSPLLMAKAKSANATPRARRRAARSGR